jgi:glutathione S-transferase
MADLTLHYMPGSCALSCHIALEWAGADYDAARLAHDDLDDPAFRALNPKGKVPALRIGDVVLTEAAAILIHIAHTFPGAGLLPEPGLPRARLTEALSDLTGEVHPAFAPLHVPGRFVTDEGCHNAVKDGAEARVRSHYDRWDRLMEGRDWVLPTGRSVADPYLYVMCRWAGQIDADLADWAVLHAFAARMEGDDGLRRALDAENLDPIT